MLMRLLRRDGLWEALVDPAVLAIVIAELVAFAHLTGTTHALAVAVHAFAGLIELLAVSHDDAAVVLCMLQVVLGEHRVAR